MRALIDTNVIIDVLQDREPWCAAGKKIFLAAANKEIGGCLTAKQLADIHFISRKQFKGRENIDSISRKIISKLLMLFDVLDTTASDCLEALDINNNDYEDAIMIATALRCHADCIITRDVNHFHTSIIPIYTPEEALEHNEKQSK